MEWTANLVAAVAVLAALAVAASVVLAIARRWLAARELARLGVLTAAALVPVGVVLLVAGYMGVANADAASKATLLAKSISTSMNCFAALVPGLFVGVPVWVIAAQRVSLGSGGPSDPPAAGPS